MNENKSLLKISIILIIVAGSLMAGCVEENKTEPEWLGKIIRHNPENETGFTWFSYVPSSLEKQDPAVILIDASYEGTCEPEEAADNALVQTISGYTADAEMRKYVLLCPVIYKNCNSGTDEWVRHFPDYVLNDSLNPEFYRLDLKINSMIDELSNQLKKAGYNVMYKVFLIGFSIGGHFANRYSLLQPNRVMAFAAGGLSGELTLPEESYRGRFMNWPMGICNFEELVGEDFKKNEYREVSQFIFWGENDHFPYHLSEKCGWNVGDYCHWYETWGNNSAEALKNQCIFLQNQGYNVTFKEYKNIGHEFTYQMRGDVWDFFDQFR